MNTADPETGVDLYIGQGGAPEGVLACAALKCVGGQFQGRLVFRNADERRARRALGITDFDKKYDLHEMVRADAIFAATGVTKGALLDGVQRRGRLRPHPHPGDELRHPHRPRSADEAAGLRWPTARAGRRRRRLPRRHALARAAGAWRERPADAGPGPRAISCSLGLSEPLARALASRGDRRRTAAEDYLDPTLKALFPDPSSFTDMDRAAEILVDALERGRPMVVFADYDVDGASSAAQLVRWFRAMGRELPIYVPDRMTEGYGPVAGRLPPAAATQGAELVITVDCGAAAYDALAAAAEIGLEVVVIDHHLMREDPPPAARLVNPNRPDCTSGQGVLAAAGVTFVLLAALNREARRRGLFADRPEPDLRQWLDLAAMGAICDVTQLVGFNRALAAQGLKVMSAWRNPGLKALLEVAGAKGPATSSTPASSWARGSTPAGGSAARTWARGCCPPTIRRRRAALAEELDALNASRKEVEREVTEAAIADIETESQPRPRRARAAWWPPTAGIPGVIGIVAGRLRERYRKPVVVVGVDRAANIGKGSGRSQPGVNLGRAVQAAYRRGPAAGRRRPRHGRGPDRAAATRSPSCAPSSASAWPPRARSPRPRTPWRSTPWSPPRGADRGRCSRTSSAWRPSAPAIPSRCSPLADVRVERPMALRGGHVRCTLTDAPAAG